ncbi:acyltransferase family protein [Clostridium tyrobutyricum]|uniref:acyltransferase family protein n=2 Tax=Clostridium tyrobutyricum TaxID=1519 RepID=UPI00311AD87B
MSGYFSKDITNDKKSFSKINNILIPYIVFQLLYCIFNIYVLKAENFKTTLVYPYWITWYLLSLFIWNLIIPYFSKVRYCILIAIFVSILCGFDDSIGYYLSLSRTITFFPYFLMGHFCEKSHIDVIKKYIRKKYAIWGLSIIFMILYLLNAKIDYRWFYGSYSYSKLSSNTICPQYMIRLFTYILAIGMSIFVLALIPGKKLFFTKLGSRTMAVYVFHGFIIKLLIKYNFFDHINSLLSKILIVMLSLLIVILLSSKIINNIAKIIGNPKLIKHINA